MSNLSNSPVIHGQLADFIDYVAFIKMQASTVTYREVDLNNAKMFVDSRPKYKNNKSTKKSGKRRKRQRNSYHRLEEVVMNININEIKNGMTIIIDGKLCLIEEFQHVKPGKGSAFMKMKLRNLRTGSLVEETY